MTENQHEPAAEHSENDSIMGNQSIEYQSEQSENHHQSWDKEDQMTSECRTECNEV